MMTPTTDPAVSMGTTAGVCGHRWTVERDPHEHVCLRNSPEHRCHECACAAVQLRTMPYQPAGVSTRGIVPLAPRSAANPSAAGPIADRGR